MLRSALIAQQRPVHVHAIVAEGVSEREQEKLRGMVDELGGTLSIYWVPRAELGELTGLGPPAAWYPLYLPELIEALDRVLYLDADTLVVDSLEPLWETDLGDDLIGFDSGVLLLDLAGLRDGDWMTRVREFALAHGDQLVVPVQDALNAVLAERRLALDAPAIRHDVRDSDAYWGHRLQTPWPAEPPGELVGEIHTDPGHPREEFFEPWREARRRRYAGAGTPAPKSRAVVTMVHDEATFLPIWLRYYSRFFAPGDIYVLDNDTADGSTDSDGFVRVRADSDRVDHTWMVETLAGFQHELIDRYDAVLVTDVDEIVAPDPRWGDLGRYIDRLDEEFVNALGYEVLHLPDREPPLDPSRPILAQRAYWFANDAYDKPLLAMVPMDWVPGFHSTRDGRHNEDPDLRLIHLHRMDYEICRSRHAGRATRTWNREDLDRRWAEYNRIAEGSAFETWFHTETGFEREGIHMALERIPEHWRGVV